MSWGKLDLKKKKKREDNMFLYFEKEEGRGHALWSEGSILHSNERKGGMFSEGEKGGGKAYKKNLYYEDNTPHKFTEEKDGYYKKKKRNYSH